MRLGYKTARKKSYVPPTRNAGHLAKDEIGTKFPGALQGNHKLLARFLDPSSLVTQDHYDMSIARRIKRTEGLCIIHAVARGILIA